MKEYTGGYVAALCVFFTVGALLGVTVGALLMIVWDDNQHR